MTEGRKESMYFDLANYLGLSPAECFSLLSSLRSNGYLTAYRGDHAEATLFSVYNLTNMGLREIGELPDPQAQLIQGFDAAIATIKHDNRLTDVEKRQKINWLEEGKIVVRTLSIDVIKAILAGAIL